MPGRLTLAVLLVIVAILSGLAALWMGPFVAQDRCLDAGGAWRSGHCVR